MLIQKSKHRFNLRSNSKVFCLLFYKKVGPWAECLRTLKYRLLNVIRAKLNILPPCINGKY